MITTKESPIATINQHNGAFAEVRNPSYIYPPVEYYPLAPPLKSVKALKAALMDMDGTTTTTEVLCIYAMEIMVRRMSGNLTKDQWKGLDHDVDLAHIIGNSTTRHVEYLIHTYGDMMQEQNSAREFLLSAHWTLTNSLDVQRKAEVSQNLKKLGLTKAIDEIQKGLSPENLLLQYAGNIENIDFNTQVSFGIDIYYEIYHRILMLLREGNAEQVRLQVFGDSDSDENLISPMPGIPFLIPFIKGWLGNETDQLTNLLFAEYEKNTGKTLNEFHRNSLSKKLVQMGVEFEKTPVKLALVTSSIFYEADIIIKEVLGVMKTVIQNSNLSAERKKFIVEAYKDYHNVYDAFVTATDSSEIRLKPHRDLYSIALHKSGLMPVDFDQIIGFEDSQSGTVALRAAGIGCCIAVPFAQTLNHDLEAATHILPAGIPEAIIDYNLFIA